MGIPQGQKVGGHIRSVGEDSDEAYDDGDNAVNSGQKNDEADEEKEQG